MQPIRIPIHHDDPQWLIIWPIDELLPIAVLSCIGLLIGQAFILFCIGWGIAKAYRFAKSSRHNGFVLHWLYGHGIYFSATRTFKNTYNRNFIPR